MDHQVAQHLFLMKQELAKEKGILHTIQTI